MKEYIEWLNIEKIECKSYTCGFCGNMVGPHQGYRSRDARNNQVMDYIYICPTCKKPTFFSSENSKFYPSIRLGREIKGITDKNVSVLYNEARDCTSCNAHTATVMLCRKILMNVANQKGAEPNKTFAYYVDYLADNGYVPPDGKIWVDKIRKKGNDANHEIALMSSKDASQILHFTEMLLLFIYELPNMVDINNELDQK